MTLIKGEHVVAPLFFIKKSSCNWLLLSLWCFLLDISSVLANDKISNKKYAFDIPAMPLGDALNLMANQSEKMVLFPYALVYQKTSNPLHGTFALNEALDLILLGSELASSTTESGVLTITKSNDNLEATQMHNNKLLAGMLSFFSSVSGSQAVQAQSTPQTALEEVIVTALKRESTLQETPIAVSVMGGDFLKDAGINTLSDLQNVAPGVSLDASPFGVNLNIRGVTTTDNTSKGDQGIAFNVDGITIGRPREMAVAFFDIERIEVLRGPQGTLYGKSTTGGVVNVITRRPEDELSFKTDFEVADFDTRRVTAIANIPITDNFATRFGIQSNKRDGYSETDDSIAKSLGDTGYNSPAVNDQDDQTLRLSGLWDINDLTTLFFTSSHTRVRGIGGGLVPLEYWENNENTAIGTPSTIKPGLDEDFSSITVELTTQFAGIDMTYVGGYREYDADSYTAQSLAPDTDWDWGNYQGTGKTKQHELRFSNSDPDTISWMVGYNFFREDLWESDHTWSAPASDPTRVASVSGIDPLNTTDHQSQGIFTTIDFGLTDRLNFTVGARYSKDEVERRGTFAAGPFDINGNLCVYPAHCVGGPNNGQQSDSKMTYRLGFDYDITDSAMVYATVSTGYKAGGFNDFSPATGGVGPYDSESLVAYELGWKGFISENVSLNSALFYYDYDKAQISSLTNVEGNVVLYTRIAPITIQGWENELVWNISESDQLNFNFSVMDSEYGAFRAGGHEEGAFPPIGAVFTDWSGHPVAKVADFTASIDYSHDWILNSGAVITGRVASRYNSGYVLTNVTYAYEIEQDAFTRTDLNFNFVSPSGRYTAGAFVRNLENDIQAMSAPQENLNYTAYGNGISVTEPRVYGVRLGMEF